jgi:AcrR family transcriptional regulator
MATKRAKEKRATDRRKAPRQERARATNEAILEATAHILVERGWARLTTNHVAERAGVSIGSVYQYFPSKDALVAALVDRHVDRITSIVATEMARAVDLPFAEATTRIVTAIVRAQLVEPALNRAILEQVPRVGRLARIRAVDTDFEALLRAALDARARELDVTDTRLCAFVIVQATKWLTMAALATHPEYVEGDRLAKELARMFVRYATTSADEPRPATSSATLSPSSPVRRVRTTR